MGWVGDYYWTHGPIVLGPDALRRALRADLSKREAQKLHRIKAAFAPYRSKHGRAFVLPGGMHTTWIPLDSRSGFLVRSDKYLNTRRVDLLCDTLDPSWFEGPWRKVTTFDVKEPLHLFDVVSGAVAAHDGEELERAQAEPRCDDYFVLELDPGAYVVHKSRAKVIVESREAEMSVFRIVRKGHVLPVLEPVAKPTKPAPLVIDRETVELAESLKFVGTDGGPFVVIHESDLPRWYGVVDEDGEFVDNVGDPPGDADYWRACVAAYAEPVEGVRGVQVLSIAGPTGHAFHRTHDGGIFIGWQGADTAAGCLGVVLAQPEDAWSYYEFVWEVTGPALLMDANRDGRDFDRERWPRVELEPGKYLVAKLRIGSANEFDGEAIHPDGRIEHLMVTAVRLRGPMKDV